MSLGINPALAAGLAKRYIHGVNVVYSAVALRQLSKIDQVWRERIEQRVLDHAANAASHSGSVKMLKGDKRLRLRVGAYRVVFREDGTVLTVDEVGHRSTVYRRK